MCKDVTVTELGPEVMVVLMPNEFMGASDAGEPLPAQIVTILNAFSAVGYWPFEFGEDHGTHTELYLHPAKSVEEATKQTKFFIACGGYV